MDGLEVKVSVNNILEVFEKDLYKGCKNKKKLYVFERNKVRNINYIYNVLVSGNYKMNTYNIFLIKHPKYRIVMSLKMNDKIINHYITKHCLIPKLSKYLDDRNIATRKNMGTDYGVKLIKKYIELNKKYNEFYILKIDISKFFYNIDHNILKSMLYDLDEIEYKLISTIIDSTNSSYINERINSLKNQELLYTNRVSEVKDIPNYKEGKGLPIGNLSSQTLGIFYTHKLDHYIGHNLGIKYFVKYMDDYVLIHHNKEYLKYVLGVIEEKLMREYKLNINKKKTRIYSIMEGFEFLGYRFKVENNKTIISVNNKTYNSIKKRIRYVNKNNNYLFLFSSLNNYYNSFKYCNNSKIRRYLKMH